MRPGGFFCLLGTVSASFLFLAGTARWRLPAGGKNHFFFCGKRNGS